MRYNFLQALFAPVLVALLLVLAGCGTDDSSLVSTDFPETLNQRVELRPESDREKIRFVFLEDDGVTKSAEQVEHRNGVSTYIFYRADQTVREIQEFHPAETEDQVERRLKAKVVFAVDGKSYLHHEVRRVDGSLERYGRRLPDGSYQTVYFQDESAAIARNLIFSGDRKLVSDIVYFDSGSIQRHTQRISASKIITKIYRSDGTLEGQYEQSYSQLEGTFFQEDGTTARASFKKFTYGSDVLYFSEDGVLLYEVEYRGTTKTYRIFNENEQELFKQTYRLVGEKDSLCGGTYVLERVTEFHKWTTGRYGHSDKRYIDMSDEGEPIKVRVKTGYQVTDEYELHPDGSVRVHRIVHGPDKGTETTYEPGEHFADDAAIPPRYLEKIDNECLPIPEKLEETASRPVYYGPWGF